MIEKATDTRQQQVDARRECINEQMCKLGDAINALPDYVFIHGVRIGQFGDVGIDIDADSFERLFAGRQVKVRREYGWIEGAFTGGDLDEVRFTASHDRYRQQPILPKDETITLPEVVS